MGKRPQARRTDMSIEEGLRQFELAEAAELVDDYRLLKIQRPLDINEVAVAAPCACSCGVALPGHAVRARLVNSQYLTRAAPLLAVLFRRVQRNRDTFRPWQCVTHVIDLPIMLADDHGAVARLAHIQSDSFWASRCRPRWAFAAALSCSAVLRGAVPAPRPLPAGAEPATDPR